MAVQPLFVRMWVKPLADCTRKKISSCDIHMPYTICGSRDSYIAARVNHAQFNTPCTDLGPDAYLLLLSQSHTQTIEQFMRSFVLLLLTARIFWQ